MVCYKEVCYVFKEDDNEIKVKVGDLVEVLLDNGKNSIWGNNEWKWFAGALEYVDFGEGCSYDDPCVILDTSERFKRNKKKVYLKDIKKIRLYKGDK